MYTFKAFSIMPALNAMLITTALVLSSSVAHSAPPTANQAADFTLPSLDGDEKSRSDYDSPVMLLHFWATWCKPCIKEMPEIEAAHLALKDAGLTVLTINTGDSAKKARAYIEKRGFKFPVLLDKKWKAAEKYNVRGLPSSYFIDSTGTIFKKIEGGLLTEESIIQIVQSKLPALNQKPQATVDSL